MNKFYLIAASLLLGSTAAFAGGYGSAGCGLGSILIGGRGFSQVFAATTNGTFSSQIFGITTGTSNCGGGGSSPTSEQYIEANKVSLASEISKGNGETVTGLAELMGCSDMDAFQAALQRSYRRIFPTQSVDAKEIDAAIRGVIQGDSQLKLSCKSA